MNTKGRVRHKILVVLTMVLMAAAYSPLSGLHLKLCIGEDGHWDITAVACASNQPPPVSKHSNENPSDHHGKCTDFTTACDKKEICNPSPVLFPRNPSAKVFPLSSVTKTSGVIPQPAIKPSVSLSYSSEKSFPHPAYLRSVVLLI